jgi:uncharacterized RDD family membrane protein YckC
MSWYYEVDRQQRGPISDEEFAALVQAGTIRAQSLVWQQGWPEWRAYGAVAGGGSGAPGLVDANSAVCAVSGRCLPKSEMLEFEGRWVGVEHKDEFFQRLREGVNLPREMVYAGFGRRLGAKIIDWILLWLIALIPQMICSFLILGTWSVFIPDMSQVDPDSILLRSVLLNVVSTLLGIVIGLSYGIYFIRKNDATPGKKMLGLRLVRADASKLSVGRIIGRYFSEWVSSMILLIGYIMAAFDKEERRALHDRMCDTRVIDVRGL